MANLNDIVEQLTRKVEQQDIQIRNIKQAMLRLQQHVTFLSQNINRTKEQSRQNNERLTYLNNKIGRG